MPNVDDHGLEVLKKAARNIGATPKTDYALQTFPVDLFSIPPEAKAFTVEYPDSTTEVFKFRTSYPSGAIVATVSVYYSNATKLVIIGGEIAL